MGNYMSKWKATSTFDELVKLDQEITYYEEQKQSNLNRQKHVLGSLLFYSVILYVVAVPLLYLYILPQTWEGRFKTGWPILVFPIIVMLLKRLFHWYFVKQIFNSEFKLEKLREKKGKILEEVMEKETFKKAREILSKFDPEKLQAMQERVSGSPQNSPRPGGNGGEVRYRGASMGATNTSMLSTTPRPAMDQTPRHQQQQAPYTPVQHPGMTPGVRVPSPGGTPRPLPMPRPILPRERSVIDRMVDFLTADGPGNRYALICSHCASHNGMALKEEFEYIGFRCCYCYNLNPARRQRPTAPVLPTRPATPPQQMLAAQQGVEEEGEDEVDEDSETTGDTELLSTNQRSSKEIDQSKKDK